MNRRPHAASLRIDKALRTDRRRMKRRTFCISSSIVGQSWLRVTSACRSERCNHVICSPEGRRLLGHRTLRFEPHHAGRAGRGACPPPCSLAGAMPQVLIERKHSVRLELAVTPACRRQVPGRTQASADYLAQRLPARFAGGRGLRAFALAHASKAAVAVCAHAENLMTKSNSPSCRRSHTAA
jgi:hypothetical protein